MTSCRFRTVPTRTSAFTPMTALLVPLHVAANAEVLATTFVLTFVRLLTSVRIGMDLQRARSGERLAARWADVSFLYLRV